MIMKPSVWIFRGCYFTCLVLFLQIWAGCGQEPNQTRRQDESPGTPVEVVSAETRDMPEVIHAVGSVKAETQVVIRPEINGTIERIHFREGERVNNGDLLFSLDDDELRRRQEASRAALKAARVEVANTRRIYDRRKALAAQNVVSEEGFETSGADFLTASAQVQRLEARLEQVNEQLEDTRITAPFSGLAGEVQLDVGDYVGPGQPLLKLTKTDGLEASFRVPERFSSRISTGQPVTIHSEISPGRDFSGKIFFISPDIDPDTRDILIKARIDGPADVLRPGGFVAVRLTVDVRRNAVVIPEQALVPTRKGYLVYVVENRKAHQRNVTIGLRRPGEVEIRKGLEPGQTVVVAGHIELADGDRVDIEESR